MSLKMGTINFCLIVLVTFSGNHWKINGQESIPNEKNETKPTLTYPYQTDGFFSSNVTSGPILVIDRKTVFVSSLRYDGSQKANFWAGTGVPSVNGTLVPDENNSIDPLHAYSGRNIYLRLPGNLTTDKIDYLAIWTNKTKMSIADVYLYVNVSEDIRKNIPEAMGYHEYTKDNQTIFRVPKCCAISQRFLREKGCVNTEKELKFEYDVFESNVTHIDEEKIMKNILFIPYKYRLTCPNLEYEGIVMNKSQITSGLIYNSSLIYVSPISHGILSHDQFCMDIRESGELIVVICENTSEPQNASIMPNLYFPILVISTLCFLSSALCYIFILKAKHMYQKCFIGYSISMTVTFFCLILLQKISAACNFVGGLFFFSMLCSTAWLTCLCVHLILTIMPNYNTLGDKVLYYYIGFSLAIPGLFLFSSIIPSGVPDVPKSFIKMYSTGNICSFGDTNLSLFFVPIGILKLTSFIALCYTSLLINKQSPTDYDWLRNKSTYKFMFVQCIMIFVIVTFSHVLELLLNLIELSDTPEGFLLSLIVIEYLQGVFVLIITGHSWGKRLFNNIGGEQKNNQQNDNHELRALRGQEWL